MDLSFLPNWPPVFPSAVAVAALALLAAAFGEIAAQDDARERAAETMAQRFRAELALRMAQAHAEGAPR